MTIDPAKLLTEAKAISTSSSRIRTFAIDMAEQFGELVASLEPDQPPPPPPPATGTARFFPASVHCHDARQAAVKPESAALIGKLAALVNSINVNATDWTPVVRTAPKGSPRYNLTGTKGWYCNDVGLPSGGIPVSAGDGWGVGIDQDAGIAWDANGSVTTSFFAAGLAGLRLDGPGTWDSKAKALNSTEGMSSSHGGSGIGLLFGLITPEEIAAGVIPHALACSIPNRLIRSMGYPNKPPAVPNPYTYPASVSDGGGPADVFQMGARLRLKSAFNASGLPAPQRAICEAAKTYGIYIADSQGSPAGGPVVGGMAFYAMHVKSPASYPASLGPLPGAFVQNLEVVDGPANLGYDTPATIGNRLHK